ncbi:MAG: (2Fe-2S)-binding protein [Rhizobacter sp.]|nr:(2Fe-2S)-binding protein [Rhizobacter sp.]
MSVCPQQDRRDVRLDRRNLLTGSALGVAALGTGIFGGCASPRTTIEARTSAAQAIDPATQPPPGAPADPRHSLSVDLVVNGRSHRLALDPRATLLDTLREELELTGSKKGCDHGQCGACTVHVDGRRVLACMTLAAAVRAPVTTIEGLAGTGVTTGGAAEGALHPMQQAFIDQDAFQCGYCTPGQIMSAVACVREGHAGSDDEIREYMSGNLCRCAAYPHIVAAVKQAKAAMPPAGGRG